jgi:glycosyltransferase involved in cell wall biosynthesis
VPAAFLETTLPIVFWGDCFSRLLIRDYGFESFLHADSMKNSEEIDRRLFANASVVIFTSDYAARQAIDRYGLDEKKVAVVWFGANLPETGERKEEILAIARKRPADHLKLLFMTTDWNRKRGDLALQVAEQLNSRGIKTELNILGRIPESVSQSLPSFVTVLGSVDKTKPEDVRRMQTFLSENHFLLLPSSADFTPHSIGEANSRATPVIASNVGGLPTLMRDGLNGYMIDAGCGAEAYVDKIANLWSDQVAYQSLCESSYEQFLERLNWKTAIRLFCDVVDDRVGLAS